MYAPHVSPARSGPATHHSAPGPRSRHPSRLRSRLGLAILGLALLAAPVSHAVTLVLAIGITVAVLALSAHDLLARRRSGAAPPAAPHVELPRPRSAEGEVPRTAIYTDPVTGLADRARMALAIGAMRGTPGTSGALLMIGVEGIGEDAEAEALREVARRLRRFVAPAGDDRTPATSDLPARWSAREFAFLTHANLTRAYGLADRLTAVLAEPVGTARPAACVGLADLAGATSTDDVINRAQLALRRAWQLGPGSVEWYDSTVAEVVARREVLERELPGAVRRGELDLIYQPIMDLERDRPLAVEALLRWRHPRFGTLLPMDVIPAAEEAGVSAELGHWVLQRASAQLASWRAKGRDISMSINVSPREFGTAELAAEVAATLATHDLPPDRLALELAESSIADSAAIEECVGALRSTGVRIVLDEFGTGAASLTHLRRLPIDMVKIGRSFFAGPASSLGPPSSLGPAPAGPPLIDVMVGVGRRLGVDVVAAGVEAPDQLAVVRTAGCRLGQGHLFARPLPAEHTEAYLDNFPARRS